MAFNANVTIASLTVTANLTGGAAFFIDPATYTFTINGNLSMSTATGTGAVILCSSASSGIITINGTSTIGASGDAGYSLIGNDGTESTASPFVFGGNVTFNANGYVNYQNYTNATFNSSSAQTLSNNDANASYVSFLNMIVSSNLTLAGTAADYVYVYGGNLTISANSSLTIPSGYALNQYTASTGTLTLNSGSTLNIGGAGTSATNTVTGSNFPGGFATYTLNAASTVIYTGTVAQTVYSTPTYGNLTIANGSGGSCATGGATTVAGTLTLTSGILTTTNTNTLTVTNTATTGVAGGSTTSFVNGPLNWKLPPNLTTSASVYNFPVGSGSTYLPYSVTSLTTGSTGPTMSVSGFEANAGGSGDGTTLITGGMSTTEYWRDSLVSGTYTNASISLTRQTAISPYNAIGKSATKTGVYSSIGGSASGDGIYTSSNPGGTSPQYYCFGTIAVACTTPNVPGLSLTSTTTSVTGTITAPTGGSTGYLVIRSTGTVPSQPANGTTYTSANIGTLGSGLTFIEESSVTPFTDNSVIPNTHYTYYVYAYNSACTGQPYYSSSASSSIYTCVAVPTSLSVSSVTSSQATVTWTSTNASPVVYDLQYEVAGSGSWVFVSNVTSPYTIGSLSAQGSYTFEISAVNTANTTNSCGIDSSAWSATQSICTSPNGIASLTVPTSVTSTSISGSFTGSTPTPSGYMVVYSTSATPPSPVNGTTYALNGTVGTGYTVGALPANTATTFTVSGLSVGTTYYIYVYAYTTGCSTSPVYSTVVYGSATTTDGTLSTDIFRSNSGNLTNNGEWSTTSNWQSEHSTSGTWITATSAPGASAASITVQSPDAIAIGTSSNANESITAVNLTVTGSLAINSGSTFTINHVSGNTTDMTVNGTLTNSGTITEGTGALVSVSSTGTYVHFENGGTVPTATWNAASTMSVTGSVATVPSGMGQTFGNVLWNATGQTGAFALDGEVPTGIAGNLTFQSTGSGSVSIANSTSGILTITGNLTITGGNFYVGNGIVANTLTVSGNISVTGGSLAPNGNAGTGANSLNVGGNWTISSPGTYSNPYDLETVTFNSTTASATQTIGGTSVTDFGNLVISTVSSGSTVLAVNTLIANNLTVPGGSTFDISTYQATGGNIFTLGAASFLKLSGSSGGASAGNNFPAFTTYTFSPISTTSYYGGNQTVYPTITYGNLSLSNNGSGTATKSLAQNITGIDDNLSIAANTSFDISTYKANCSGVPNSGSQETMVNYNLNNTTTSYAFTNSGTDANITPSISGSTYTQVTGTSTAGLTPAAFTANTTAGDASSYTPTTTSPFPYMLVKITANSGVDLSQYSNFGVYFDYNETSGGNNQAGDYYVAYSTNGTSWTLITDQGVSGTVNTWHSLSSSITGLTIPSGTGQTLYLRITLDSLGGNGSTNKLYIDNFEVQATTPTTFVYGTLAIASTGMLRVGGTTSTSPVSGSNFPAKYSSYTLNANSTVEYYGNNSATQYVYAGVTYGNLNLKNYSGSGIAQKGLNSSITGIAGNVGIYDSTELDLQAYTLNHATPAAGTFSMTGTNGYGYLRMSGTTGGIGTSNFPTNFSTYSLGAVTTQEFYGTGQTVPVIGATQSTGSSGGLTGSGGYGNLTLTGTTETAGGNLNVQSNLLINSGGTFAASTFTHTVGGNWTNSGTFTAGTGSITFDGLTSATQNLNPGTNSFYNLVNNSAGTVLLYQNPLTTTNTFTNFAGTFNANSLTHTVTSLATVSGGNYIAGSATQTFNGGLTVSGGTFTAGSGTVYEKGSANSLTISGGTFSGSTGTDSATNVAITSGTLTAPSGLFSVTGNWVQSGGTFAPGSNTVTFDLASGTQTISTGSGGTAVANSAFNNINHIGAGLLQILTSSAPVTTGGTFTNASTAGNFNANGQAHTVALQAIITGGSYLASTGTQTFNGSGLKINGGTFTGSTGNVFTTNDTLSSGTLTAPSGTFSVSGNWANNGGTFTPGALTNAVTFSGSSTQVIGGSQTTSFSGLTISNTGTGVTLIDANNSGISKTVNGQLTLNSGLLTSDATDLLKLSSTATTNLSAPTVTSNYFSTTSSYVNGPIQRTGSTAFFYPVGQAGIGYVPAAISATSPASTQTFTVQYIHQSAYTFGPVMAGSPQLTQVSGCDYWRLDLGTTYPATTNSSLPAGTTANITLYWNPNNPQLCPTSTTTNYVTNLNQLLIGHLNFVTGQSYSGLWGATLAPGGIYNFADQSSGTMLTSNSIQAVGVSTFSPFTLASTTSQINPLSLKLDYFTGTKENGYNTLSWKAECNSETASFTLQRSSDGVNFTNIDSVQAATATECSLPYNYNDYTATGSKVYYRLEVIDQNGNITYSQLVLILNDQNVIQLMNVRPNPVQTEAWLNISASENQNVELVIYSIDGKQLVRQTINVVGGMNTIDLHTSTLANGMYIVRGVFMNGQTNTLTFVKQ
jgi:hypothetical protein